MCTVVCRWTAGAEPVQILALRDELVSRAFDPPGDWWPAHPGVIGGRDGKAGGSWCVCDVASGVTAVVTNRPERRTAEPGAASRGVLPLIAVRDGENWPDAVDVAGMASFNLVLVGADSLQWWSFDGERLEQYGLPAGTYMFTPRGIQTDGFDERFEAGRARLEAGSDASTDRVWGDWLDVLSEVTPSEDPAALLVRKPIEDDTFETVFGQFIVATPGALRLDYRANLLAPSEPLPQLGSGWTTRHWPPRELDVGHIPG